MPRAAVTPPVPGEVAKGELAASVEEEESCASWSGELDAGLGAYLKRAWGELAMRTQDVALQARSTMVTAR